MDAEIYCLVDGSGKVHVKDGAECHSEIAADFGLDESACQEYRFDLTNRQLLIDRGTPASDQVVRTYVNRHVGSPERLMEFAREGHLPKRALANLLTTDRRGAYLDVCAVIEKKYTEECTAKNDPCLESGCAVEGEICLQPLLRAWTDYHKACAAEWIKLFASPPNRIDSWKN